MNTQSYLRWGGSGVPRTGPGRGLRANERESRGNEKKSKEEKKSVLSFRSLDLKEEVGEIKWE